MTEIRDKNGEAKCCVNLGNVYQSQYKYAEAKAVYERAITIMKEISDKKGEAASYLNLGTVYRSQNKYAEAKEVYEKAITTMKEIGDKNGEATCYGNLGNVYKSQNKYVEAKELYERAITTMKEIGDKNGEANCYVELGNVYQSPNKYVEAKELYERAVTIMNEIGDKNGEATCYGELGNVYQSQNKYVEAKELYEKAITIMKDICDKNGEAKCCVNLENVYRSQNKYVEAKELYEKAIIIMKEIGDKEGEAKCYESPGIVYYSQNRYVEAKELYERANTIMKEIGDKNGEASCYGNLGSVFASLGEYVKAKECFENALAINQKIDGRKLDAALIGNLGSVYISLRNYRKSKEYLEKAITINMEIGDRAGEAAMYQQVGKLWRSLGDNVKAKEYLEKALEINMELGYRVGEAGSYASLGTVLQSLDEHVTAQEYFEKALSISQDIGEADIEIRCCCFLAFNKLLQEKVEEAISYLFRAIENCEDLRGLAADNDEIKISLADVYSCTYEVLRELFCYTGNPNNAIYVAELGRARALADLMTTQYSAETHISVKPQSWISIENVMTKESNCTCLYICYFAQTVSLWILKTNGNISFRKMIVDKKTLYKRLAKRAENVDEFFAIMAESFRSFGILPEEVCEDRSLNDSEPAQSASSQDESLAALRNGKDEEDPEPSLTLFHEMLINPVSDLLQEPEIIIVPDRNLYRVPFAALLDKSGKYLSETYRIRIVPSLTTLKLIQDSPTDYHSQTGALIVGDPDVGDVIYNGRINRKFVSLPGARKEAEMIGRLLGVQPLLGQHATKQAVLQRIDSVSLIHFATRGNAERGEIALTPSESTTEIPQEEDYLLKMSDISQVQLRAKLVVLSCCHSARGQIRAEGVVGIARAFLGSGARSVLVALWALEDSATEQLMSCFYEHLVRGESASESLHEAMKWMRDNGFTKVSEWAPFMLIGDNVTFDFGKEKKV